MSDSLCFLPDQKTDSKTYRPFAPRSFLARLRWSAIIIFFLQLSLAGPVWSKGLSGGGTPAESANNSGDGRFDEKIDPFSSDSDLLGLTASAPFVQVNEFTGKVSIRLPSIGASGLSLTPRYLAPNRQPTPGNDTFPYRPEYERSPLGIGWHLHPGLLVARQGNAHLSPTAGQGVWERVGHLDSGGNFTPFQRDGIFQSIPDGLTPSGQGWGDSCPPEIEGCLPRVDPHFVDDGLRRITREVVTSSQAPAFAGSGSYFLLEPNGRRTRFEPTATVATDDARTYVYFYPTEVIEPNGRTKTIHYTAPLMNNPRPLISSIEDSFGRHLDFVYQTLEGRSYVHELWLRDGHGVATQVLARFAYVVIDGDVHLRSITTPEGHRTLIDVESEIVPGQLYPFVDQLTIPQGGEVKIDYAELTIEKEIPILEFGCYDKYNCHEPQVHTISETWLRVARLEHSGGRYRFTYTQDTQVALEPPHDWQPYHGAWTWGEDPVAPLTVVVEQENVPTGEKTYSRTTTYFGFPTAGTYQNSRQSGNSHLIGRPAFRREQYCHRSSATAACPESKEEVWVYSAKNRLGGKTPHLVLGGTGEAGAFYVPTIKQYALRQDEAWIETEYFYNYFGDDVQWGEQIHTDLTFPFEITREVHGSSKPLHQRFDYLHRFHLPPVTALVEAVGHPFVLGLHQASEQTAFTEAAGVEVVQKRIETDYHSNLPLPRVRRLFGGHHGDHIQIEFTYFESGTHVGLLETRTLGGPQFGERNVDYRFGVASRVEPMGGTLLAPATVREVNLDGTLASETSNGVTRTFSYDLDGRRIRTDHPLDASETIDYSPPLSGPPDDTESCLDNWVEVRQGVRRSRRCSDAWGRVGRSESDVDAGVVGTTRWSFDSIGLQTRSESALGAVSNSEFDVWGRPVVTTISDRDTGVPIQFQRFEYSMDAATGNRRTRETLKVSEQASEEVIKIIETDLAGRMVVAGYGDEGPRTRFEYHHDGTSVGGTQVVILPDGNTTRYRWTNWLGQIVKEWHPEIGTTHYEYDSRGLMTERYNVAQGVESERVRYSYDPLGRLIREEAFRDGAYHTIGEYVFDPSNGQQIEASAATESLARSVKVEAEDFDAQQRPLRWRMSIPKPYVRVDGLRPRGTFPTSGPLPLRWFEHEAAERYRVEFRRREEPSVAYEVFGEELVLDASALETDQRYQWRVRSFSREHEPSPWTEWLNLSNGCRIESFAAEDGIDEGPLIQWRSRGCDDGEHTVRVLVSTLPGTTEPGCALVDGLFSGHLDHDRRAHFMAVGYNYEDVAAAHAFDPDYVPDFFGPKDCAPIEAADFRIAIEHLPTGDVIDERAALRARVVEETPACRILNFYVNDGYDGLAPEVTWQTRGCAGRHIEVRRYTLDPSIPTACEFFEDPWANGENGQRTADFMTQGWQAGDQECSPVSEAEFSLEVRESADPESPVFASRSRVRGEVSPDHGGVCHIRYLGLDLDSPSDQPPVIRWQTQDCEGQRVSVLTSTVDGVVKSDCLLRQVFFAGGLQGQEPASYMAEGYVGHDGASCGLVSEAFFWVEAWESEGPGSSGGSGSGPQVLLDRRLPIRAEYLGAFTPPQVPCEVEYLTVTNRGSGQLPLVSWETTCADSGSPEVSIRATTVSTLPGGCAFEDARWRTDTQGVDVLADFMVGGGGVNHDCPPVEEAEIWLELRDTEDRVLLATPKQIAIYDPPMEVPVCEVQAFQVENRADDLPVVSWHTNCPENGSISVQVRVETEGEVPAACSLGGVLWDGHKSGSRPVEFMVGGYGPNCVCGPVSAARFWIELRDETDGGRLVRRTDSRLATYSAQSPVCELLSCSAVSSSEPNVLPLINWSTSCAATGPVSVQVKTTTPEISDPTCRLDGALWDGNKNGSRTADYMAGDYSVPPHTTSCPAVEDAFFWVELRDETQGGRLLRRSDFMPVTYQHEAPPCRILSFEVLDDPVGGPPRIRWQTDCPLDGPISVQVKANTGASTPTACALEDALFSGLKNGSKTAKFMVGGYGENCHCPAVESAWFHVELIDTSNGNQIIQQSSPLLAHYNEPTHLPCDLLSCSTVSNHQSGVLPVVSWSTNCSAGQAVSVQVKTSTDSGVPSECQLDGALWDGHLSGSREAAYMAGGYSPENDPGTACPPVSEAFFWVEVYSGDDLIRHSDFMPASYSPPAAPCSVNSFQVVNSSTAGTLPIVQWATDCSSSDGVIVQVKTETLTQGLPANCTKVAEVFSELLDGSLEATYMAGIGLCPAVDHAQFWLELRDAGNPSILYERTSFHDAFYIPGK